MNVILWAAVGLAVIVAAYVTFFTAKPICSVTIYGLNKENFVKHKKPYKGYLKKTRNKGNEKTIYWFEIRGNGQKYTWRPIQYNEFVTTSDGKRHVTLAHLGLNDFRILNPVMNHYKYQKEANGLYRRKSQKSLSFEVYTEEDQYFLADVYDELDELYKRKEGWWEQIKPFATIAVVGLVCLLLIWSTADKVLKTSENNEKTTNIMVDFLEKRTSRQVDENTEVTQNIDKGGG